MGWWQETKADVRKSLKWAFSKSTESKNESEEYEVIRTRDKKGQYVGDDKSTPDVNEAYTRRKKR
jgi:hypothetical protein